MPILPPQDLSDALFLVWSEGLPLVERIRRDLMGDFRILADIRCRWTPEKTYANFQRLYRNTILKEALNQPFTSRKVTDPEFHLFYVRSEDHKACLHRSAAWEVERVNPDFVAKKALYRDWTDDVSDFPYLVHCAATIEEVRLQTTLLLGPAKAQRLWSGQPLHDTELNQDLIGAHGWPDRAVAFEVLSLCTSWCVFGSANHLLHGAERELLELLVEDRKAASAALGLIHQRDDLLRRTGKLVCADSIVDCDLYWPGDGCLDPLWESRVIRDRVQASTNVYFPNDEHTLFIAIYREYVHRETARPEDIARLAGIARKISHSGWLTESMFSERQTMLKLLSGYMTVRNYVLVEPVGFNRVLASDAVRWLPTATPAQPGSDEPWLIRWASVLSHWLLPRGLRRQLISALRRLGVLRH